MEILTLVVGCVGGGPVIEGRPCSLGRGRARLLAMMVCGRVDRMVSGGSGVVGEYTDWETAGTW